MATIQELREQRATVWDKMTEINDRAEKGEVKGEDTAAYAKAEAEFETLDTAIAQRERHDQRAADNARVDRTGVVPPDDSDAGRDEQSSDAYMKAFEIFVRNGLGEMDNSQRQALRAGFAKMDPKDIKNAAGIGTTSAGGYLVPPEFRRKLVEKMKAFGHVMDVAEVIQTDTGATLPWPTNDDTGNVGALLAENTAATEQDFVFGIAQVGAYKYTTKIVRASLEFLQDTDWVDAEAWIQKKFAERLGRIHNQHFTTGTGTNQPLGIVTGAVSGVTAATVGGFTADELIDLQHSVDPAYRNERAKFMLSDAALKVGRKLKDGQGRYLFQVSTSGDVPNLLAGSPYVVNQDMAAPATGVKSVLYGDYETGYLVRVVKALEFMQLRERYAEFGQVGFIGFDRMDGTVQDANAYRALTQA